MEEREEKELHPFRQSCCCRFVVFIRLYARPPSSQLCSYRLHRACPIHERVHTLTSLLLLLLSLRPLSLAGTMAEGRSEVVLLPERSARSCTEAGPSSYRSLLALHN